MEFLELDEERTDFMGDVPEARNRAECELGLSKAETNFEYSAGPLGVNWTSI
ncbi:MAG: hypothetical protein DHS20C16_28080 [Phycisphaerae bacterium]|nr:MAG: hypothetical protein DHS20C16_28080 [Phycisphaerae bacterium]